MEEWRKIYFLEKVRGGWALLKKEGIFYQGILYILI